MDITQRCHLVIEDLSVARGERVVLGGVYLQLGSSQLAEVTGPNGVGKSTLLRAIAGFLPLRSGRMSLVESEAMDSAPLAERLHYVGHLDGLKSALTARENLEIGLGILGRGRLTPLDALERLELAHVLDLPVGYLSAGQRRRVALARLLVADRPLWLLDEPLTALDRHARALLKTIVVDHLGRGGLMLAATHEPLGLPGTIQVRLGAR
ncbi:heme ABC exporter ATP-binding protein CcmA [Bradyrhizobium canariense]|uniref:Heme ABC exporter ATP-binding protein CcmA n=1 Tax=Bradyrhizobium canariense TaxID=255045 RepID=A0ABX3WSX0_9BRAD|nr:heme ABC exporter ATP-binding protein CcmA [Bradyrhizobium canariense]OSJ09340.1 heme ABC exporter ATP-binding protein CcmA [Bradyrhizobium canariense]OSJ21071.1 heme ABC exporter ATP-binding protein CcmA [Bradyrhizobium canariense]